MLNKIKAFQKDAERLGTDKNSIEELKLWAEANLRAPEDLEFQWSRKPERLEFVRDLDRMTPGEEGEIAGFLDNLETYPIEEVISDPENNLLDEFIHPIDGKYFILGTLEGDKYLVDTGGYDYARYVVKLPKGW